MRAAPIINFLIPAVLGAVVGGLFVSSWRREPLPQPTPPPAHGLKLQAYEPVIPKAPVQGPKLETSIPHPRVAPPAKPEVAVAVAAPPQVRVPQPIVRAEASPPRPRPAPRVYASAEPAPAPGSGRYVAAPGYSPYAASDPRVETAPEPAGFRLNAKICRSAARQADPLAETAECQGILQAARTQAEACARAFDAGDDKVAMSAECRQAAVGR